MVHSNPARTERDFSFSWVRNREGRFGLGVAGLDEAGSGVRLAVDG